MTEHYRVFVSSEAVAVLRAQPKGIQQAMVGVFDKLAANPFQAGDYVETDQLGRPIQVLIAGRHAICYWPDHAAKEVKILDLKSAGS